MRSRYSGPGAGAGSRPKVRKSAEPAPGMVKGSPAPGKLRRCRPLEEAIRRLRAG